MNPPRRSNGEPVSRAELGAHLERLDAQLSSLHAKVDAISAAVHRPQIWFGTRLTKFIDWGIIAGATAVIAYAVSHT